MPNPKGSIIDTEPLQQWEWDVIRAQLPFTWQVFYWLLWDTGLRVGEALALVKEEVLRDLEQDGAIVVRREKQSTRAMALHGGRMRVSVSRFLEQALRTVAYNTPRGKRLWPYTQQWAWQVLREAAKRAGITRRVHPHQFRRSYGTRMVGDERLGKSEGERLRMLAGLMGHASTKSTELYLTEGRESIERASRRIAGR